MDLFIGCKEKSSLPFVEKAKPHQYIKKEKTQGQRPDANDVAQNKPDRSQRWTADGQEDDPSTTLIRRRDESTQSLPGQNLKVTRTPPASGTLKPLL